MQKAINAKDAKVLFNSPLRGKKPEWVSFAILCVLRGELYFLYSVYSVYSAVK